MTRPLNYILILIPLTLASLYLGFFGPDHGDQVHLLQGKVKTLERQTVTLKTITRLHGAEDLKRMESHHRAFKKDPQESLKPWALKYHVTLSEITRTQKDAVEGAFTAPLDTDVYAFIKDLEKNYFTILSLGLYRDKILNTIQGRLIIRPAIKK